MKNNGMTVLGFLSLSRHFGQFANVKVRVAGDAGFSLCGGLVKTTKSLSAFLSWFISSLLVDG